MLEGTSHPHHRSTLSEGVLEASLQRDLGKIIKIQRENATNGQTHNIFLSFQGKNPSVLTKN